jgi:hypothetical protein
VLTGKIAPGWKIVKPIALDIERDEGFFIISNDIFLVYGYGDSLEAARADYIQSLLEYYDILVDKTDGPTRSLFRHLKSYLRPIPA